METKSVLPTTVVLDFTATAAFSAAVAKGVNQHIIDANINLVALAKKSGIPRQTLQRRLSGHAPFTVPELAALAAILGKRPHDFLLAAEATVAA